MYYIFYILIYISYFLSWKLTWTNLKSIKVQTLSGIINIKSSQSQFTNILNHFVIILLFQPKNLGRLRSFHWTLIRHLLTHVWTTSLMWRGKWWGNSKKPLMVIVEYLWSFVNLDEIIVSLISIYQINWKFLLELYDMIFFKYVYISAFFLRALTG